MWVDNAWRPFIQLHEVGTDRIIHFDMTRRVDLIEDKNYTLIVYDDKHLYKVKESVADIIKDCEEIIDDAAKKKIEEAKKYREQTEAKVIEFQKHLDEMKKK